jgi:pyruvate-ferredoxin/flavodoxin oxidoreductase
MLYGPKRRRVPAIWDVDLPLVSGGVQNQDAYMQATAGQRPYFFDHVEAAGRQLHGRIRPAHRPRLPARVGFKTDDADYVILGMGSMIVQAEAVADYLRETRKLKVGVVNLTMFRPFPGDLLGERAARQEGRGRAGTHRPAPGRRPAADARSARHGQQVSGERHSVAGAEGGALPRLRQLYAKDMPRLYSGCYGLGSRDLQPEGLIGAIENMLPGSARKFFYLSIDFVRDKAANPSEMHQQDILAAYPRIKRTGLRGSENPNLLPKGAITVRMHSVGGWGAITTGKNLAMTLFELLGWDIKANPKYGSEKKGQPTTYYLSAAPEPIRVNCEYTHVDVVLSPDPAGVLPHQPAGRPEEGRRSSSSRATCGTRPPGPPSRCWAQKFIVDNGIRVFYLDAFQIAREEASAAELQLRMQGNAFQGAFFHAFRREGTPA